MGFTSMTIITIFVCFGLPSLYEIRNVEEYNPQLIQVGAFLSGVSFVGIVCSLWSLWGLHTIIVLFILRKGFYGLADLLPRKRYNEFSSGSLTQAASCSSGPTWWLSCTTASSELSPPTDLHKCVAGSTL